MVHKPSEHGSLLGLRRPGGAWLALRTPEDYPRSLPLSIAVEQYNALLAGKGCCVVFVCAVDLDVPQSCSKQTPLCYPIGSKIYSCRWLVVDR